MVSPLYEFSCVSSDVFNREKGFSHWSLWHGFSPVLVLMCLFRYSDREKYFSHWLQEYGFSPVLVLMCLFWCSGREKDFHTGHSDKVSFSPVWVLLCLFRCSDREKVFFTWVTRMSSYVFLLVFRKRKRFLTLVIGIGFLPYMNPLFLQMFRQRKRFFALVIGIWFLPCISSSVSSHIQTEKKISHICYRIKVSPIY